ncbi:DUF4302 domain-containing protein [Sphingobacterium daejeonense]|uniref:DUF4302 domain-containing protein n=1 Tax=Sphingobacterium daejeonense TaxID=371142 RepID=UPI0010C3204E|nr:DUF4302 domain-containing protein [Sphingobacterium daejeonense]VTP96820.1 Uncharacterised protein [Sphingobacterium daejeonense]
MKKYIIFFILLSLIYSCKKGQLQPIEVDKVWPDPVENLKLFKDALASNKTGWEYTIAYGKNKTITYGYLGFNSENSSDFIGDFSKNFSKFDKTNYNISIVQSNVSLSFPERSKFGNLAADAKLIDTIYTVKKIDADTIFLEGEIHSSLMKLTKCSAEKLALLKNNSIELDFDKIKQLANMPRYFFHYHQGGKTFGLEIDTLYRSLNFISGNNENPISKRVRYYFNGNGLSLESPITLDGLQVKVFENLEFDNSGLKAKGEIRITNEKAPKIYDLKPVKDLEGDRTKRLWWVSYEVFSQRGKPDIAGFTKLPNYTNFSLAPNYDYFEPADKYFWYIGINLHGINPGSTQGFLSETSDTGIIRFIILLETEESEIPEVLKAMNIAKSYIYNPIGFYVIKTGVGYTLVDARDALTWAYFQDPAS